MLIISVKERPLSVPSLQAKTKAASTAVWQRKIQNNTPLSSPWLRAKIEGK
jgi:hypothetical protein